MTGHQPSTVFRYTVSRNQEVATVVASGEIDLASSPELRQVLYDLVDDGARRLVLDLGAVTFVDSSGLGVLVGALKRINETGDDSRFEIRGPTPPVQRVFEITGLDQIFVITG